MHLRTIPSGVDLLFLNRNLFRNAYKAMHCLKSSLLLNTFPSYNASEWFVWFPTKLVVDRLISFTVYMLKPNIFHITSWPLTYFTLHGPAIILSYASYAINKKQKVNPCGHIFHIKSWLLIYQSSYLF